MHSFSAMIYPSSHARGGEVIHRVERPGFRFELSLSLCLPDGRIPQDGQRLVPSTTGAAPPSPPPPWSGSSSLPPGRWPPAPASARADATPAWAYTTSIRASHCRRHRVSPRIALRPDRQQETVPRLLRHPRGRPLRPATTDRKRRTHAHWPSDSRSHAQVYASASSGPRRG